jgi:CheY-like chemotaxis protein
MDRSGRDGLKLASVLLVDDDAATSSVHRERLQAQGYQVIKASDATLVLTMARQTSPRVIFLSVSRFGSGRTPLLQALRRDDQTRHIPVAILSASNDRRLERLGLRRVGREVW